MEALASVFAIDVLSYAVMSNHLHQILRNRPDVCAQWSDKEVAIRWLRVLPGRRLEKHLAEPTENDVKTLVRDKECFALVRHRLSDISSFMGALSEPVARMVNTQDESPPGFGRNASRPCGSSMRRVCSRAACYVDLTIPTEEAN